MRFTADQISKLHPELQRQVLAQIHRVSTARGTDTPFSAEKPLKSNANDQETTTSLAPKLRHAVPEHDAGEAQVCVGEDEKGGAGRIEVCITRFGTRLLDADNLAGGCKYIIDGLRYTGVIPEDNPAAIILKIRQEKAKKGERGTLIEVFYPERT